MGLGTWQPFRPIGCDGNLVQFVTESWSGAKDRDGKTVEYEVHFDIGTQKAVCSCMDATCRQKNFKPIGDSGLCKHARKASETLWPVIKRAIGA